MHKLSKIFFLTLLAFTLTVPTIWASEASTVTVQGESHREIAPDQALITFGVINSAETAEDAREANAASSQALQQKLAELHFTPDQITTSQFTITPLYTDNNDKSGQPPVINGYRVTNTVTVKSDDPGSVGTVIDAALSAGANQVNGVRFQKKSDNDIKTALLGDAVKNAMDKAEAMAGAVHMHIKKVVSITEQNLYFQQPEANRILLKADFAVGNAATAVSPGIITASGTVTVVCEIE